jgi:hypothetical protein
MAIAAKGGSKMTRNSNDKQDVLAKLSTDGIALSREYRKILRDHNPNIKNRYWTYYCQWDKDTHKYTVGIIDRVTRDWIYAVTNDDLLEASLLFNNGLTSILDTCNRHYTLAIGLAESEPTPSGDWQEGAVL